MNLGLAKIEKFQQPSYNYCNNNCIINNNNLLSRPNSQIYRLELKKPASSTSY